MSRGSVVLINENRMRPPVAPLALDYIGGRLASAGYDVRLVDLSWTADADAAVAQAMAGSEPVVVGVSFRNTDDCFWPSGAWFVPRLRELITRIGCATDRPIVLGGCGFSVFPRQILNMCGLNLAVVGDGEDAFLHLIRSLEKGEDFRSLPGIAWRGDDGNVVVNPPRYGRDLDLPTGRGIVDNARYLREGAMGNIETKRGCPYSCIYCADPIAKGAAIRLRPPTHVADEVEALLRQGVDVLHLCDAEFNIPPDHALAVCRAMIERGLGERVRWYCYASAAPFSGELASAMRRAGCVGINFGVDSGCDRMLAVLGRNYRRDAIREVVGHCRREGMAVMLDLLIGGPGEDPDSVRESIEFIKDVNPDRAGAAMAVRVYPGTHLARLVGEQGAMAENPNLRGCVKDNDDFFRPVFYLDRRLGEHPARLVTDLIGRDDRFFQPASEAHGDDYNYNDNQVLEDAIAAGYRGAFWDILRRLAEKT